MDKPKCRLCGAHHWSSEPHKFEPAKNPADVKAQIERKLAAKTEVNRNESSVQKPPQGKRAPKSRKADDAEVEAHARGSGDLAGKKICPVCGMTPESREDAAKWAALRDKRRKYMRKRRSKNDDE